jgi:hypothetical protein
MRAIPCVLVVIILLAGGSGCSVGLPRSNRSEFVISTGAGFLLTPDLGARYGMNFELRRIMDKPVYVVAEFENPEKGFPPLRSESVVEPGTLEFLVQSPRLTVLSNDARYSVRLTLYWDAAHTRLLGRHRQEVLFSLPQDQVSRVEEADGIRIL